MRKKSILISLIFIFSCVCFFNIAFAETPRGEVYLASDKMETEREREIEITVNIENRKVSACNFYIYFDEEKVEFVSNLNQEEAYVVGNRLSYVWYDKLGGAGAKDGNIASFKFKAKENGLASFVIEGEFYGENGELIETNFRGEQVQIGKEESVSDEPSYEGEEVIKEEASTNLEILAIENVLLYPAFDASHTDYEAEVSNNIENLNVFAVPENEKGTVEVTGKDGLKEGDNLVTVLVRSEDGSTEKMYNIKVKRRSIEEEKSYEQELSRKQEELENAYKVEKLSSVVDAPSEIKTEKRNNNYVVIVIMVDIALIAIGFTFFAIRKKRRS